MAQLDFAIPLAFIAMCALSVRNVPLLAPALLALLVAIKTQGHLVWTVISGMLALHSFTWLVRWL